MIIVEYKYEITSNGIFYTDERNFETMTEAQRFINTLPECEYIYVEIVGEYHA